VNRVTRTTIDFIVETERAAIDARGAGQYLEFLAGICVAALGAAGDFVGAVGIPGKHTPDCTSMIA
jgi:hypothetical protein